MFSRRLAIASVVAFGVSAQESSKPVQVRTGVIGGEKGYRVRSLAGYRT